MQPPEKIYLIAPRNCEWTRDQHSTTSRVDAYWHTSPQEAWGVHVARRVNAGQPPAPEDYIIVAGRPNGNVTQYDAAEFDVDWSEVVDPCDLESAS